MPRPSLACLLPFALLTVLCARPAAAWEQDRPGRFDYYILVLGWSPSYSEGEGAQRHCRQCDTDKPGGFVLHGLWPQYMRGWPQDFRIQQRPWVPRSVIDDMADIMPSKSMIIHEYRAHGTCAGLEPKQYFSLARDLYDRITIPPRFTGLDSPLMLSPDEIEGRLPEGQPLALGEHDLGDLSPAGAARCARLLRARSVSEELRTE